MRLVGLLLLGLGGLIVWAVFQGQKPLDHLQQLIDLFGHQHLSGVAGPAFPFGPADRAGSGQLGGTPTPNVVSNLVPLPLSGRSAGNQGAA